MHRLAWRQISSQPQRLHNAGRPLNVDGQGRSCNTRRQRRAGARRR
jgi:hypothetical protein